MCVIEGRRSAVLRRAALALATLAIGTLALAARADAAVYWANFNSGTIGRANLDGSGANQSFITGAGQPVGMAVDADHVYWTDTDANAIARANLDGSGVNRTFVTGASSPVQIAVDNAHLYWTNFTIGAIARADLDSPRLQLVGRVELDLARALAVRSSSAVTLTLTRIRLRCCLWVCLAVTLPGGPTATPEGPLAPMMKRWFTPEPSRLARAIAPMVKFVQ